MKVVLTSSVLTLLLITIGCGSPASDARDLEIATLKAELTRKDRQIRQLTAGMDMCQILLDSTRRNYELCVGGKGK